MALRPDFTVGLPVRICWANRDELPKSRSRLDEGQIEIKHTINEWQHDATAIRKFPFCDVQLYDRCGIVQTSHLSPRFPVGHAGFFVSCGRAAPCMFDCLRAIEALPADAPANLAGEGRSIAHRTLYHSTAIATTTVNHSTSRIVNRNMGRVS